MISAKELKELPNTQLEFMFTKTEFEIKRARYTQSKKVLIEFTVYSYENLEHWRREMTDLGYDIQKIESDITGVSSFLVML